MHAATDTTARAYAAVRIAPCQASKDAANAMWHRAARKAGIALEVAEVHAPTATAAIIANRYADDALVAALAAAYAAAVAAAK